MIMNATNWFSLFGQKIPLSCLHFGWMAGIGLLLLLAAYLLHAKMLSGLTGEPLKKIISKPVLYLIGAAVGCHLLFFFLICLATVQAESARRALQDRFGRYPSVTGLNELYLAEKKPDKAFWDFLDKSLKLHRKEMFKLPGGKTNALYEISPCRFLELTGEEKRIFRNNLEKVAPSLAELDKRLENGIPKLPLEMKESNVFNTPLLQLNIMRSFGRQMEWRTYMALEAGNPAEAFRISELTRKMAQYGETEVFLIGSLVDIACYHIYFDSLEQLAEKHALTRKQIQMISRELLALEKKIPQIEKDTLYSEAVGGNDILGAVLSGEVQKIRNEKAQIIPVRGMELFLPQFSWMLHLNQAYLLRFYDADDFGDVPDLGKKFKTPDGILARFVIPGLRTCHLKYLLLIARSRAERVLLACELFRMDNGKYPASASELAPKYLDRIPNDPVTGKPLLFRTGKIQVKTWKIGEKDKCIRILTGSKEIDGIQVWSVGPNGRNDDGHSDYKKKKDDIRAVIRTR